MKPIIDIQLSNESVSSAKILSGYVCLPISISGQWVWIKRASTEEDENDAIVDMHVTQGSERNLSDKIHQSPGVGWIKVGGNFSKASSTSFFSKSVDSFVWFRPQRTRSQNFAAMVTPSGLSQDVRQSMILIAVRNTLRSHVPTREVKRLANLHMEVVENDATNLKNALRSDRLFDYAALYHLYDESSKSHLDKSRFSKMLLDAGIRMDSNDVACVFYYFNSKLDGYISREEYSNMLTLTDSEIDILVDSIRSKLLSINLSSLKSSTNNSTGSVIISPATTTIAQSGATTSTTSNVLHDNILLSKLFKHFNSNNDGMLSIDEILDLAASLEIFLTEEEARKLMRMMDMNGNDRIEEPDFIEFMNKKSEVTVKKALRLRECVASFRRWLKDSGGKLTPNDNKTQQLWATFKSRHEKASQSKFPGHLVPLDILLILGTIPYGTRVTMTEAREITLMVGPDAGGCISQDHLYNFVSRNCRSFGELLAILERDLIKKMIDAYKKYQDALKNPSPSNAAVDPVEDAREKYENIIKETVKQIQGAYVPSGNPAQDSKAIQDRARASTDVVSLGQLKAGVEIAMRGFQTNESQLPNMEEWACTASLVNAIVAGDNTYGVKLTNFFESLCPYIVEGKNHAEKKDVEVFAADLQRMIQEEAKAFAAKSKNGNYDYRSVFSLFDIDNSGTISSAEFKDMLKRLKLLDNVIDTQIPQLINRFDMNRNGIICYEDFVAFAESRASTTSASNNVSGVTSETASLKSSVPIPAITKNKDCDELLWLLWIEASKLEPGEPSWVINEIESLCLEIVATNKEKSPKGISVKELWSILIEIGIRSDSLSKVQFEKGIKYLCNTSTSNSIENDTVDYTELCRYVIRMGRQYNQDLKDQKLNENKRFESLFLNLKNELKRSAVSTGVNGSTITGGEAPRYERVFSRLDSDNDGILSIDEFKTGLERLNVTDVNEWTKPMIQRLFDEIDINRDGFIALKEFNDIIGDDFNKSSKDLFKADGTRFYDDDDDDDDIFVNSKKGVNSALYTKVGDVLYDAIPKQSISQNTNLNISTSNLSLNHQDEVKSAIRKYFSSSNSSSAKGYTTYDKWLQFIRRSGLQSTLTSVEMRRLSDLLKVKKSSSLLLDTLTSELPSVEVTIDYEKLIKNLLFSVDDSAPRGKVEVVLQRLQDAVNNSNVNGRPFLGLCSLVDTRLSGRITKEELIHTIKMMGSTITFNEIELLCANIPELSTSKGSDHIDYKELFYIVNQFTPRTGTGLWLDTTLGSNSRRLANQTLPNYTQPSPYGGINTPHVYPDVEAKSIATPGGLFIQTPYSNTLSSTQRNRTVLPIDNDKKNSLLTILCNNIAKGISDKTRVNGAPFSILRQFEVYDKDNNGLIPLKTFVRVIEDLGVLLTSADVSYISQILGRPEDDQVSYDAFMQVFNAIAHPTSNVSHSSVTTNFPSYFNTRVLNRLKEIKEANSDRDLKDYFEIFDLNRIGVIDNRKFREVMVKLNLLQTEYQINKAIEDFASLNDKSLVVYDNFLTVLNDYCNSMDIGLGYLNNTKSNSRYVYGSGYDGLRTSGDKDRLYRSDDDVDTTLASNNVEKWLRTGASPKQRKEFDEIFDSLQRFKLQQSNVASGFRDFPNNLEDGSYIPPPKVSESISLRGSGNRPPLSATSNRYNNNGTTSWDNDYTPTSPTRRSNNNARFSSYDASSPLRDNRASSPMLPRTSPSKVGTVVWGRDIPISQKGRIPKLDDGNWCCAVCLYIENPISSKTCGVCDTPNYTLRKDYSVKEICSNCTFSNGQLAVECEMCGEPLSRFHY